ncbi:MAG TPA: sugar ABC transporter permease [Trebonia sp.]|nr:sugar ABC transporter permease [Trebonia sp.]
MKQTRKGTAPRLAPYAFVAPAVAMFVLTLLIPIGYTLYLSLEKTQVSGLGLGAGARKQVFAGLSNYSAALTDHPFLSSLLRVLAYSLVLVPVMLGLALLFALLLDARRVKFQRFARLSIFLPYAVPTVIGSLLWGFLYLPTVSPFPAILARLGLSMPGLFAPHTVLFSVANIGVWGGTGFNMIVMYTALRAVPSELYEAARIDGASQLQIALRIKIPMIAPALVLTGVFSIIATLQVFNEPETLLPLTNTISLDWMPLMRVYDLAFNYNNIYGAAALALLIAAVMFLLSFGLLRLSSRRVFQER